MWNKILAEVLFVLIVSCILILAVGVVMTPFWSVGVLKDVMNAQIKIESQQLKIESQQREINDTFKKMNQEYRNIIIMLFKKIEILESSRHFSIKKKEKTFKESVNPYYRKY